MSKLRYKYYLGSSIDGSIDGILTLWRFTPEGYSEISTNRPDDWSDGYGLSLDAFNNSDKLTKREARRFFPRATIL